ncbi:Crp/Fnr family transcriptional regulator [Flavobacterium cupreum]|uniref:CRP-like cAMP-binding protein n=2 Tax=Flavobacterium TaxID=237 RepID=A0A4Y7UFV9_9FLAO|nr:MULTISPECIES: Crp/Fnr family transcriptional regulator [Flavobacterium]RUT67911.1 Crp/Fnr family transcriptional regulator [Flavobacterium cupreum]TCN59490.1 CRP-like cAMP-binding protein [Flavobacterium circumlabens]TEB44788.1 Crp/Fnr family transcriptional regulator [Flavobacterium circumlabens]
MTDFQQFCNQFSELNELASLELVQTLKTKTFQKGDFILKSGMVCKHFYFVNSGLVKMFSTKDDKEFIVRFFSENLMFTAFESYLTQTASNFAIIALETTTVTLVSQKKLEELCKKHHSIETFFRKLVSVATLKMTKRIREMLEENATNRYNQFMIDNDLIVQRISLGEIAKYVGITQQSLSRIRNQK